jgi:hypothetical protein
MIHRRVGISGVRSPNNPDKARALLHSDIERVAETPHATSPTPYTSAYLRTKRERMAHRLSLGAYESLDDASRASVEMQPADAALADLLS